MLIAEVAPAGERAPVGHPQQPRVLLDGQRPRLAAGDLPATDLVHVVCPERRGECAQRGEVLGDRRRRLAARLERAAVRAHALTGEFVAVGAGPEERAVGLVDAGVRRARQHRGLVGGDTGRRESRARRRRRARRRGVGGSRARSRRSGRPPHRGRRRARARSPSSRVADQVDGAPRARLGPPAPAAPQRFGVGLLQPPEGSASRVSHRAPLLGGGCPSCRLSVAHGRAIRHANCIGRRPSARGACSWRVRSHGRGPRRRHDQPPAPQAAHTDLRHARRRPAHRVDRAAKRRPHPRRLRPAGSLSLLPRRLPRRGPALRALRGLRRRRARRPRRRPAMTAHTLLIVAADAERGWDLGEQLDADGHTVHLATDRAGAIAKLSTHAIDVVILARARPARRRTGAAARPARRAAAHPRASRAARRHDRRRRRPQPRCAPTKPAATTTSPTCSGYLVVRAVLAAVTRRTLHEHDQPATSTSARCTSTPPHGPRPSTAPRSSSAEPSSTCSPSSPATRRACSRRPTSSARSGVPTHPPATAPSTATSTVCAAACTTPAPSSCTPAAASATASQARPA